MFAKKAEPLSYAEGPRLHRAIQALPDEQQASFIAGFNEHLKSQQMTSVQRRGQYLYITFLEGKKEKVSVYDFGREAGAQSCLTALTDCLRSSGVPIKVLMASKA